MVSHPLRLRIFLKLLSPSIPLLLLESLDSYSTNERASVESFFETYIQVVILAAKSKSVKHAIQLLLAKRKEVDKGYKGGTLSPNMHTQFYVILGNCYNKIGDVEKSNRCYSKIVHKELGHCYPKCDYFSLSVAYENIGDKEQAFKFRKLAFHHKLSLALMDEIKLLLYLYNDYMNTSLGNDVTKAEEISVLLTQTAYTYLLNADRSEYSREVYYMAIEFFRSQNMKENVDELQKKIVANAISCDCETINIKKGEYFEWTRGLFLYPLDDPNYTTEIICNYKCAIHYVDSAIDAFKKQYYHLAIYYGEQSFESAEKLEESYADYKCIPLLFVGKSYYQLGNYSAANVWLHRALQCINKAIRYNYLAPKLRNVRVEPCFHLLLSGEVLNILCYIHIVTDFVIMCTAVVVLLLAYVLIAPYHLWKQFFEISLSSETSLMKQRKSFIWTQFNVISDSVNITHHIQQWTHVLLLVLIIIFTCCYYTLCCCCCSGARLYIYFNKVSVCKYFTIFFVVSLLLLAIDEISYYLFYF